MTGSQNVIPMVTKELNSNGLTLRLRKYGKICVVTCNAGSLSKDIAVGSEIARLPSEFKPYGWCPFPDQATGLNDTTLTAGAYYAIDSTNAGITANKIMKKGSYIRFVVAYTSAD